jgi:hypothetical protein
MPHSRSLIDDLETALRGRSTERRTEVLRRVADLFLGRAGEFSEDQILLFDDVIGHLIVHIEERALAELSTRFAPIPTAPIGVIGRLARHDAIVVSGPMLRGSERLTDADLIEIANTKSQQHLLNIAGRLRLNEAVTDVLVDRGDAEVASEVAGNAGARFSNSGFSKLVMRTDGDERLMSAVASRTDVPPHLIRQLLTRASDTVRERLIASAGPEARQEIDKIIGDISGDVGRAVTPRYYAQAKLLVRSFSQDTALTRRKVLEFAHARRLGETVAALSALSGMPIDLVDRLIYDPGHYGIMVLCKASELDWVTTHAVLSGRRCPSGPLALPVEEVYEEFQTLAIASAQRLLRFWQVRQKRPAKEQESVAPPVEAVAGA